MFRGQTYMIELFGENSYYIIFTRKASRSIIDNWQVPL